MCSLTTVCSCVELSGYEDHSAVIVEYCMSTAWTTVRTDEFKNRKRVQHSGDHKDNDQLIALKMALPESIACLLICFEKQQAKLGIMDSPSVSRTYSEGYSANRWCSGTFYCWS